VNHRSQRGPYRVREVVGDRYSEEFVREHFRDRGIAYIVSPKDRSALYVEMVSLLTAGTVELLDHPRLITQLCALERRTGGSGKDQITHPCGTHDDVANAWADRPMLTDLAEQARREKGQCRTCGSALGLGHRCPTCDPVSWSWDEMVRRGSVGF
jgi:hypothetical protein